MGYRLGIDLGTTYTAAAVLRDGRVEMAPLGDRSPIIPSVVCVREDGTVLVGDAAERRLGIEPDRVAREFKRRFGDPTPVLLGGSPYGAEVLQSHLLRHVVAKVTELEGSPPDHIVLTHPANWGPYKKELIAQTIRQADLDPADVSLVSEPEAAAIHYASRERVAPGALVAVYDLGGGTFDAAVLRRTDDGYEIVGTPSGIERLGGIDFDEAVSSFVLQAIDTDLDADDPETVAAWAAVRRDCVAAKEALASDTDTEIIVSLPGVRTRVRLTRAEFEQMARPSVEQTVHELRRAVAGSGIPAEELSAVLLVGGSSRIPLIAQAVSSELGLRVALDTHPKFAVAMGAALFGTDEARSAADAPGVDVADEPEPATTVVPVVAAEGTASVFAAEAPVVTEPTFVPAPAVEPPTKVESPVVETSTPATTQASVTPPPTTPTAKPSAAAGDGGKRSRSKGPLVAAIVVLALIAGGVAAFTLVGGDKGSKTDLALIATASPGTNSFITEKLSVDEFEVTPVTFGTSGSSNVTTVVEQRGTKPGLYAGVQDLGVCDRAGIKAFMKGNATEAKPFAEILGISQAGISAFVDKLTPVTLLSDLRVTVHEFDPGSKTSVAVQAILQAGSSVAIDNLGVPRIKCVGGDPLSEAVTFAGGVKFVGTEWSGFDPNELMSVTPGGTAAARFVLIDLDGGKPFSRKVGAGSADDQDCGAECGVPLVDSSRTLKSVLASGAPTN